MPLSRSDSGKSYSWTDVSGNVYQYYKHPMTKAVLFVLLQELCERLAFYGLMPNLQIFLKEYLGVDDAGANSYISTFNAILYVTPLLSAVISDTILGLYLTILVFSFVYMAGLALLTLSTIHSISQPWMIHMALLFLIAFGAGGIKSCVNVMGAQQFHPEEHKDLITRYYTYFYASINLGSIVGGIVTPILVESVSFTASFSFPLVAFILATIVFVAGDLMGRYVKPKPQGSAVLEILKVIFFSITRCSLEKNKESNGGRFKDGFIEDAKALFRLGKKMDTNLFGWDMPAQMMQNVDPIAVVLTSVLVDTVLFPLLKRFNLMPPVLVRFCIGSLCGAASLLVALGVEYMVMSQPVFSVSIWWQIPQFWLIAAGEIFLISTSYEVAFTHSPGALKAVASAFNLCFFSISNVLSAVLFQVCSSWLPNFDVENPTEEAVSGAHYDYYYMVLVALCVFGAVAAVSMIPYFNKVAVKNAARKAEAELEAAKKDEVAIDV
ncbi:hypothetical protein FOZ60_000352 [Perkinsus olseni]|uniref:Peptide transporter ptr2 n=1 Tax=Perkinsus olseni TaxID=32597 RepID=A0A7J6N004_PEROL|nr:hypothetical protein FOZ60_000352 [Perkinsus olseni]